MTGLQSHNLLWVKAFGVLVGAVGVIFVVDAPAWLGLHLFSEQYLVFILYSILAIVFVSGPPRASLLARWTDRILALTCLAVAATTILAYSEWVASLGIIDWQRLTVGILAIILLLEAIRRTTGWFLVAIVCVFTIYAAIAGYLPGRLHMLSTPLDRIVVYLFLDPNSLLGATLWVGGTLAFAFVLFGQVVELSGAGDAVNRLAFRLFGKYRGGPAYAAVVASGQFGGLTGSVTADIYVSGTFTIPMMKRVGFRPEVAAGVEAASSTGAGIMPPVMDPGAFLLAQNVGIPYTRVAVAAILPALLYYWSVLGSVRAETHRSRISAMSQDDLPEADRRNSIVSWSLLAASLAVLIYTMFILALNPALSAIYAAIPALIVVLMKLGSKGLTEVLFGTVIRLRELMPVVGGAGLLIGLISLTGIGTAVASGMVALAHGSAVAAIALTVCVIVVLGMGMPPFVVYAISAVVLAPVLIETGAKPLAAHLFILYWALFAQLTPPVCIAAIVAANVAGTNPWVTAWHTLRIGMMAFLVPFLFLYNPALLLDGSPAEITVAAGGAFVGVWIFIQGTSALLYEKPWLLKLSGVARLVLAFGFLIPSWAWTPPAAVLVVLLTIAERRSRPGEALAEEQKVAT